MLFISLEQTSLLPAGNGVEALVHRRMLSGAGGWRNDSGSGGSDGGATEESRHDFRGGPQYRSG